MRRALVYCRESRDDFGEHYERIETQRDILLAFCAREGLSPIVEVVMDDNVSGTQFARMEHVLQKARAGEMDVLVLKDASRLGRNLRESLNFMHAIEEAGVQVVFESERYDEQFFPLLAWFNEQRAREDSQKVRRVFRHKMEMGELLIHPPYGYIKTSEKQLAPHPETSLIVRRIFTAFAEGQSARAIADTLCAEGIPTPSQSYGDGRARSALPVAERWMPQHIYRILGNPAYTGRMVYARRTKKSYKSSAYIHQDPEDWITVEDHHEAIVQRELFELAQEKKRRAKKTRSTSKHMQPLSGLLFCGKCGARLVQRIRPGRPAAYVCATHQREGAPKETELGALGCRSHHIRQEDLLRMITAYLQHLLKDELACACEYAAFISGQTGREEKISSLQAELGKQQMLAERIYEDYLDGLIDRALYRKKIEASKQKAALIQRQIDELAAQAGCEKLSQEAISDAIRAFSAADLDRAAMQGLFEKIVFFLPGEISQRKQAEYALTKTQYERLDQEGGLVFLLAVA